MWVVRVEENKFPYNYKYRKLPWNQEKDGQQ